MVSIKIAWISAPPFTHTGYGKVTRHFVSRIKYPEIELISSGGIISGPYFDWKSPINGKEFRIYPGLNTKTPDGGLTLLNADKTLKEMNADCYVLHSDCWAFRSMIKDLAVKQFGGILYSPIDGGRISAEELEAQTAAIWRVAMCKYVESEYTRVGLPCSYVPHGVDPKVYYPRNKDKCREELGLPKDDFLIGFVGTNISRRKGIAEMIMAFKKAYDAGKKFKCVAITQIDGIPNGGYHFYNVCDYIGLPRKTFLFNKNSNGLTEEDMALHYGAFDILVNVSHGEGFGIPILESMACGTPVVGTDFSSMPELISGHGWLIPPKALEIYTLKTQFHAIPDYDIFGDTLIKIIGNNDLIKSTGKRAAKFALKYDWDKIAPEWDRMFRRLDNEGFFPPFRVKAF